MMSRGMRAPLKAVTRLHDVGDQRFDLENLAVLDLGRHVDEWAGHLETLHAGGKRHHNVGRGRPESAIAHLGNSRYRLAIRETDTG
jgi:hypothetical protein